MEEVRAAAMACYANLSTGQKQAVQNFYKSLDANGDGMVTSQEYLDGLRKAGLNQTGLPSNLFQVLDKNNDGTLDLEECVTLYYMITGKRLISCDGCGSYMLGLHFLCVECYRVSKENTFDLCCSCYCNKNFNHVHSYFLDNFAILRTQLPAGNTWAGAGRSSYGQNKVAEAFETGNSVAEAVNNVYNLGSNIASAAGYNLGFNIAPAACYNFGSNMAPANSVYNLGSNIASDIASAVGCNLGSNIASDIASVAGSCTIM